MKLPGFVRQPAERSPKRVFAHIIGKKGGALCRSVCAHISAVLLFAMHTPGPTAVTPNSMIMRRSVETVRILPHNASMPGAES